jgi:two-component system phosphate regulon response regulator PhoB
MKSHCILIVEDETSIRDMIKFALTYSEFEIAEAKNTKEALEKISLQKPDLILLDWMLPDTSGIDFIAQLKKNKNFRDIRIIMLTAKAEEENKIKGLEVGADDYITKPFSPRELIMRIKTVLRRSPMMTPDGIIQIKELCLNTQNHTFKINSELVSLTAIEYKLLHFFMTHPNRVYNREQLLDHVWQGEHDINDRTVDVLVKRLRTKLQPYGIDNYIQTIRSYGYQFIGTQDE